MSDEQWFRVGGYVTAVLASLFVLYLVLLGSLLIISIGQSESWLGGIIVGGPILLMTPVFTLLAIEAIRQNGKYR